MLATSLILSSVLFVVTAVVAWASRPNLKRACIVSWAGLAFAVCPGACLLPAYGLHAILLGSAGVVCWLAGAGVRTYLGCSLAAMLSAYGLFAFLTFQEIEQTKQKYPMESMSDRLAYAVAAARSEPSARADTPPVPIPQEQARQTSAWVRELDQQVEERVSHNQWRTAGLKRLHEETVVWFQDAPGFGVSRMRGNYIPDRDAETVSQPDPSILSEELFDPAQAQATPRGPGSPKPEILWTTHYDGLLDFVNADGFGYVKDRRHVAGFQSHQFRSVPRVSDRDAKDTAWSVRRVELVSLLKGARPAVYVSDHLPRMAELRDAPTRTLDGFEAAMLPALQQGEDLKLDYGPDAIRMLGAIRAGEQCLKCHDGQRGDLLGAFSYRLKRGSGPVKNP